MEFSTKPFSQFSCSSTLSSKNVARYTSPLVKRTEGTKDGCILNSRGLCYGWGHLCCSAPVPDILPSNWDISNSGSFGVWFYHLLFLALTSFFCFIFFLPSVGPHNNSLQHSFKE
ncbi:hypothetical protein L6164_030850 [Bauhinia variegata]|uniref:Uncharacterized protein n=1 Tax=Bauhinia variegata TaxID=167791 RepID=A0ACB9LCZ9_BAUVA|nr:hypothetical protein L6164_030850 [Bauhinia variegata]